MKPSTDAQLSYSHGFDHGNYASAYELQPECLSAEDLDTWIDSQLQEVASQALEPGGYLLPPLRVGLILGLWSSYELHEIPKEHHEWYLWACDEATRRGF